jgi:hypothetical protein
MNLLLHIVTILKNITFNYQTLQKVIVIKSKEKVRKFIS